MTKIKIFGIVLIAGLIMTFGSEIGHKFSIPGVQPLVPDAEARVGRPLTPVSVGGVARRSVRRCAAGVYHCSLPTPVSLDGLTARIRPMPVSFDRYPAACSFQLQPDKQSPLKG